MKKTIVDFLRALLLVFGFFLLFVFLAPLVGRIFNLGTIVGAFISALIIFFSLFYERIIELAKALKKSKKGKILLNSFISITLAITIIFSSSLISVIACSGTNAKDEKTVIVLGCAVYGETPSIMLKARTLKAEAYLESNPESVAILSGGKGDGESISEAECMRRILVADGIDEDRLFLEEESTNTDENIRFSAAIIEENNLSDDIAIASSNFHLKRATMIAKKYGVNAKRISVSSGFFATPTFFVRDAIAVIKEFIFR